VSGIGGPEEPVAYLVLGSYVHPNCARDVSLRQEPVYASELPPIVFCRGCEDQIIPAPCVFCEIVAGRQDVEWIVARNYWNDAVAFVPLNPVTEGHCLIVPKRHVKDFAADPETFADAAKRAAELMRWTPRAMNVITSRGTAATQSVFHLHLHLVPREENDGLALPWYSGKSRRGAKGA
jgi:histidine triad (HIT) family protein